MSDQGDPATAPRPGDPPARTGQHPPDETPQQRAERLATRAMRLAKRAERQLRQSTKGLAVPATGPAAGSEGEAADPPPPAAISIPPPIVDLRRPAVEQVIVASHPWRWLIGPLLAVVLPTILTAIYLGGIATPRYEAEATAGLRSTAPQPSSNLSLSSLGLAFSGQDNDSLLLVSYLRSQALVESLDASLGLRRHWADPTRDRVFRLTAEATREELVEYFRSHTAVQLDGASGLIRIIAQGYDPVFAQRLVQSMLEKAEEVVNRVGHQTIEERLRAFDSELARADAALAKVTAEVVEFQGRHRLVDAKGQAQAITGILLEFDANLARTRATLGELLATMGDQAEEVLRTQARLRAMETERKALLTSIIGPEAAADPEAVNRLTARQAELDLAMQQAVTTQQAILGAREQALMQVSHKLKQLVVIDPPVAPEEPAHPKVLYWTLTVAVILSLLYAIGRMVVVTVREHRD